MAKKSFTFLAIAGLAATVLVGCQQSPDLSAPDIKDMPKTKPKPHVSGGPGETTRPMTPGGNAPSDPSKTP